MNRPKCDLRKWNYEDEHYQRSLRERSEHTAVYTILPVNESQIGNEENLVKPLLNPYCPW